MRTKKAIYNYLSEVIPQFIILILGFFKVKVFLVYLGQEMVGLFQVFTQLLSYLSLLEGGAGGIIGYHLYKPISENDTKSIGSILSATIKFFTIIGVCILLLGSILNINIMFFISNSTVEQSLIHIMFFLILISNVLSYLYTPYTLFLDAKQERYRYNLVLQPILIVKSVVEILLVIYFKNLFVVLVLQLVMCIFQNTLVRIIFKKHYSDINLKEKADFGFIKKIKDIVPHKIGSLIAYNIDIVIISKFVGVSKVVIYTSYYYITEVLQKFVDMFASAVVPGVGNLLVSDSSKSYDIFKEYNEFLFFISTILCVPLFSCISGFVGLWYGKDLLVNDRTVFLFVWLLFYRIIRNGLNTFVAAAGLYKETIKNTYLESTINLILSIVLVKYLGIFGILLGTTAACILSEYCIKPRLLNKKIFKSQNFSYYKDTGKYTLVYLILLFLFYYLYPKNNINNLLIWFINSLIMFIINGTLTILIYKKIGDFKYFNRVKEIIKGRLKHGKS